MRGARLLIWVATLGAIVAMFWPLVSQMLTTMRDVDPGFY